MRDISEEHGGDDCENGTDPKHAGVYGEVESADGEARGVASEHGEARSRTDYPESGAGDAKNETLRQQSAAHRACARAQSRAHSSLALTAGGARQAKIGDDGANT